MMARRNVLNGATAWEREERANQQRDYAAQLQEQVLQKQVKQEQEKQRKRQEQRDELELMERERAAGSRKPQSQAAVEPPPPVPSPQRVVSMPHIPAMEPRQGSDAVLPAKLPTGSNLGGVGYNAGLTAEPQPHEAEVKYSAGYGEGASYAVAFNPAPSIFESLLRKPGIGARSTVFYDDLAALQRLSTELDTVAKERRSKTQNNYSKPSFILHYESSASSPIAPSTESLRSSLHLRDEKINSIPKKIRAVDPPPVYVCAPCNQTDKHNFQPAVPYSEHQSSNDGLLEESILLPLSTAIPSPPPSLSKSKIISRARVSSTKQDRQFVPALNSESALEENMVALQNRSEMMHFTQ